MCWTTRLFVATALCTSACNETMLKHTEPDYDAQGNDQSPLQMLFVAAPLDVVFVIDNSSGMALPQRRLAEAMDDFVDALEQEIPNLDVRFAFTTTDNGNPICGALTTPEGGAFVAGSCTGRLEEFSGHGSGAEHPELCEDVCPYSPQQLDARVRPTMTDYDTDAKVRPWLERGNLPEGIELGPALACYAMQGVRGCGLESPLESMYKALMRARHSGEDSYGFLRDDAALAVVVLTNEVDCSYRVEHDEIFTNNHTFWSDPDASFPTSAVCWNAGSACSLGPDGYDDCWAADRTVSGAWADEEADAVLHPVRRYVDVLESLQTEKRYGNPDREVLFAVIGGVPPGYPQVPIDYVEAQTPERALEFGIGPGCVDLQSRALGDDVVVPVEATPPVRLRAVAEQRAGGSMYSICEPSYVSALEDFAEGIAAQFRSSGCYAACPEDTDPTEPGLQPTCVVSRSTPTQDEVEIPECQDTAAGPIPPAGEAECYVALTGDDRPDRCIDGSIPLAFRIVDEDGAGVRVDAYYTASCVLSEYPTLDCPGMSKDPC